ncbi:uncharacterized protein LOC110774269 [Prunus avium]|uniref:Uncharacterized protein LOC110774269 n=1 Tax=Prunus avium TaxID=42229 RepID=A0A6P5U579_PRUAV|nr:uncharacterized protein LOC110774269 [Prunus avium]
MHLTLYSETTPFHWEQPRVFFPKLEPKYNSLEVAKNGGHQAQGSRAELGENELKGSALFSSTHCAIRSSAPDLQTMHQKRSDDLLEAMEISLDVPWSRWCDLLELHTKCSTN